MGDVSEAAESDATMNIDRNDRRTPAHIGCWIWSATLLVLSSPCLATTIVAVRTPDAVVIAADSEGTFKGGNKTQTRKDVRKIFEEDGILYAISGIAHDPGRGFDAAATVSASLHRSESLQSAAINLERTLYASLEHLLSRFQNEDFALFQAMTRKISEGEPEITSILLASFQNGEPTAIAISFSGTVSGGKIVLQPKRIACPDMCPNGNYTFFLGKHKAIDNYVAKMGKHFAMSPEDATRFMVQLEIDAKTPGVGPPIEVVRMDRHGIKWLPKSH
jgi:hypothetical protein